MQIVPVRCTALIPAPIEAVFNCITGDDILPLVLTGYGPLPGVTHTSERQGQWHEVGASRRIHLAGGSCVRESLTLRQAPHRFAYRVWAFEPWLLKALTMEAQGHWEFTEQASGTHIDWVYSFTPRNVWAVWPLRAFAATLWRGYMRVGLRQLTHLMAAQSTALASTPL